MGKNLGTLTTISNYQSNMTSHIDIFQDGREYRMTSESTEKALREGFKGEVADEFSVSRVIDADGRTVFDHREDVKLTRFCTHRGFDWVSELSGNV